jgi:hypothetical protein
VLDHLHVNPQLLTIPRTRTLFVSLPAELCERKVELLEQCPSQRDRRWFTADTFWALLRLRGVECNAPSGFAEAFHCQKATMGLPRSGAQ